jgi:cyclase
VAGQRGRLNLRFAVNTHLHGDHTYGNSLLPGTTTIIGHENMRRGLEADTVIDACPPVWAPVPEWGAVHKRLPTLTFRSALTLHSGSIRVEIAHPGHPAHTDGDAIVWMPDRGVLFAGDLLFNGITPLVFMGSIDGARRSLDWIAGYSPTSVVPGHGPVIRASELDTVLGRHSDYYDFLCGVGESAMSTGTSPLAAAREADLGAFARWPDAERIVLNLHRYLADHGGAPFDLMAAFADATAYHGGPLHTAV